MTRKTARHFKKPLFGQAMIITFEFVLPWFFEAKNVSPNFIINNPCFGHDYYITICVAMTLFEAKHVSPNFVINLWNCVELFNLYFIVYVAYFAVICPIVDAQEGKKGEQCCWVHPNEQKFVSYNQLTIGINLSSITNDPNVWRQHTRNVNPKSIPLIPHPYVIRRMQWWLLWFHIHMSLDVCNGGCCDSTSICH